jgi:alanine racemase
MYHTASAQIDLTALRHNLDLVRGLCPGSRVMAIVKADAYGHGAIPGARAFAAADGLAVVRLQEALELRQAGISRRLLLLGTLLEAAEFELCSRLEIEVTAHDPASVAAIAACARTHPLRVWLKFDCGMHRLGLDAAEFAAATRSLGAQPGVTEIVHMTHFSETRQMDSPLLGRQAGRFAAAHAADPRRTVSVANSAVLIARPDLRGGWVRPGLMLYGDNPLGAGSPLPLRPAMRLSARVIAVRRIATGEAVGYDGLWVSARPSLIATVGIGYADGYPRHAAQGTPVWIGGRRAELVGRVSMDFIAVDVTDGAPVAPGDEAVLWGPELPVATVAECAGTASYELLTGIGRRVARHYVGEEEWAP